MLVELYVKKYNIQDGLDNDVDEILKRYKKTKNKNVDVVWIEFVDPTIRKYQRNKHSQLYEVNNEPTWTPIL